ncbi:hypothetical protein K449DRAFT_449741 [Hypoxylon sp. EC38]|nr:hypothetical protein K449DRAFT_449741 [Hypoxylon sp. EC38]
MAHQEDTTAPAPNDTRLIRIPVVSGCPGWFDALSQALLFMRPRNECYAHVPEVYNLADDTRYLTGQALEDDTSRILTVYHHWRELVESGNWVDEVVEAYEARQALAKEMSEATIREAEEDERRANNNASTTQQIHLLDFPVEIVQHIFEYAVGGHELQANLVRMSGHSDQINNSTQLIFYKPRLWADLSVFQVCRAFRTLAIECYGVPQKYGLPFSPKMDTLLIHGEKPDRYPWLEASEGITFPPNLWLMDLENEHHFLSHDNVYSFNYLPADIRPWSTAMVVSDEFLQRVTNITMAVDVGTFYKRQVWIDVWTFLAQKFLNTRCLKFNICHMDVCGATEEITGTHPLEGNYKAHDTWFLGGLVHAGRNSNYQSFSKLEALEVEKVATCCSRSWRGVRIHSRLYNVGNAFFKLGPSPQ